MGHLCIAMYIAGITRCLEFPLLLAAKEAKLLYYSCNYVYTLASDQLITRCSLIKIHPFRFDWRQKAS